MACQFCNLPAGKTWFTTEQGVAIRDAFPISQGHTLVVPRAHVASLYDLPTEAQQALWAMVADARARLQQEFTPEGFNIGINDGQAAGQTVMHAHIHVIPRYKGDIPDPRGGIRWIIPAKAKYWT